MTYISTEYPARGGSESYFVPRVFVRLVTVSVVECLCPPVRMYESWKGSVYCLPPQAQP
jgi:hypothetical protein